MILISPRPETEDTIHILTFTNINVLLVKLPCKETVPELFLKTVQLTTQEHTHTHTHQVSKYVLFECY